MKTPKITFTKARNSKICLSFTLEKGRIFLEKKNKIAAAKQKRKGENPKTTVLYQACQQASCTKNIKKLSILFPWYGDHSVDGEQWDYWGMVAESSVRGKAEWNLSKLRCHGKANQKSSQSNHAPWGYNKHQVFHLENLNSPTSHLLKKADTSQTYDLSSKRLSKMNKQKVLKICLQPL